MNYEKVVKLIYKSKGKYYVYILLDNDIPFYVGRGKWFRVFDHEKVASRKGADLINNLKYKTINNIWKDNRTVDYKIFGFYETVKESKIIEALKIRECWKLGTLTNIQRPFYNALELKIIKPSQNASFNITKNLIIINRKPYKIKSKIIQTIKKLKKDQVFYLNPAYF